MIKYYSTLSIIAILSACSDGGSSSTTDTAVTPTVTIPEGVGTASSNGTTYTITSQGKTISATPIGTTSGGPLFSSPQQVNGSEGRFMVLQNGGNIVGVATNSTQSFAGISGTTSAPTTNSGIVTYAGRYIASNGVESTVNGQITLTTNFTANTVVTATGSLNVNGTLSGNSFSGTATSGGKTTPISGGFYNGNQLNAAGANGTGFAAGFATTIFNP